MQPTIKYIAEELQAYYPGDEIAGLTRIILSDVLGVSYTGMALKRGEPVTPVQFGTIRKIVGRLKKYEPIQYITGKTEFYGLNFKVSPSVLIPRPETEELVNWAISSEIKNDARILDIGTGSGCIALSLKKFYFEAQVAGVDISEKAIITARENAHDNNLEADFFVADILNPENYCWPKYDLIISNPPYVRESEKQSMQANVLDYEPGLALFVPDSDPLLFYRGIAGFSYEHLNPGGFLFFETNEAFGNEVAGILAQLGFKNVELRADINGKYRMVRARR